MGDIEIRHHYGIVVDIATAYIEQPSYIVERGNDERPDVEKPHLFSKP